MYKLLYPTRDATIYQRHPLRNTGVDQILEITKITSGSAVESLTGQAEYWGETLNSRILMDFNLTEISRSLASGAITNPQINLVLKATETVNLPISYTLMAYPVSGSWANGTGYYNNDFEVTNGVSWDYRHGEQDVREWTTPGGDYYTGSSVIASQSFDYESADLRMDITPIVRAWFSGSIVQNGIILKHTDSAETSLDVYGSLKFFSKDTHTIYVPRIEILWSNVDVSGTGSISVINTDDYTVNIKNLKDSYKEGEISKLRIGVRPDFPSETYSLTSAYMTNYILPSSSFYSVVDTVTDEEIVPFHEDATRVNCDSNGNYITVDFDTFMPVRYYKVIFKVKNDGEIRYIDNNYIFKVMR